MTVSLGKSGNSRPSLFRQNPQVVSLLAIGAAIGLCGVTSVAIECANPMIWGAAGAIASTLIHWGLMGRVLALPMPEIMASLRDLAAGNLTAEIRTTGRSGEIAQIFHALSSIQTIVQDARTLGQSQLCEREAVQRHHGIVDELTHDFNLAVQGGLQTVSDAASQLRDAAHSVATMTDETARLSASVASAAASTSSNSEAVAAAADRLARSEAEIARLIVQSWTVTKAVGTEAADVNVIVQSLAEAASSIGEILHLITEISAQTNLLALNATMEAARAGESGRGFAVVANEVKRLAGQTAHAALDISTHIGSIQAITQKAGKAIAGMTETIAILGVSSTSIAAAVETQAVATQEIAASVHRASIATKEVTDSITQVKDGASTAGISAVKVFSTANLLSRQSEDLSTEVADFLANIKIAADRPAAERREVQLPARLSVDSQSQSVTVMDMSLGAASINWPVPHPSGTVVALEIGNLPPVKARLITADPKTSRLQFALDTKTREALESALSSASV